MKRLVWLASYPRSGNTWLRLLLANYLATSETPLRINELTLGTTASWRHLLDDATGLESSTLTDSEIDRLWPGAYRHLAAGAQRPLFLKVHAAWRLNDDGVPAYPADVSLATLYVVRHPFDVAISMAAFTGQTIDAAIALMCSPGAGATPPVSVAPHVREYWGTWSDHVRSWANSPDPAVLLRYEDLARSPGHALGRVVTALGWELDHDRIARACVFSSFDELQRQESTEGFRERPSSTRAFFRRGQVGQWRRHMTPAQMARLRDAHGTMMQELGYLDDDVLPLGDCSLSRLRRAD